MAEIVSLEEAVAELVSDGDAVALEGFTHLIPHAAGHELIRQGRRDLTLIRLTPDVVYDQLIGTGCARKLVFSWGGNPGVGSLHRLREAVEHGWPGPLELEEHSHAGMAAAYAAGAANLPFAVLRGYAGTDLPGHTRAAWIECPFTGERLAAVRALRPDVGIIHAQRADRKGNVQLWGISGVQKEAVLAAARSLVNGRGGRGRARAGARRRDPAHLGRERGGGRAGRRASLLRARLLRARQRLLPPLGRDQPRPGRVRRLDPRARAGGRRVSEYTAEEMMAVAAARKLRDGAACFVGIGLPSRAANLARATHAPGCVLIYESGTIGAKPLNLPLSIGDGELAETADTVVSVPEIFSYWLQGGRIDVGFLGAAQIDRYANLNSTVIGAYDHPKVRLPGGGGAPEIAASCKETLVILKQSRRTFVETLDFRTSVGFGDGPGSRERLGLTGGGVSAVITDLGELEPDPESCELTLTRVHPGRDGRAGGRGDRLAAAGRRRPRREHPARRARARGAALAAAPSRSGSRPDERRGDRADRRRRRRHGRIRPTCTPTTARPGCGRRCGR